MLSNKKEKVVGVASKVLVITVADGFDTPTSSTVVRHDLEDACLVIRPKDAVAEDSLHYQDIFFEEESFPISGGLVFLVQCGDPLSNQGPELRQTEVDLENYSKVVGHLFSAYELENCCMLTVNELLICPNIFSY